MGEALRGKPIYLSPHGSVKISTRSCPGPATADILSFPLVSRKRRGIQISMAGGHYSHVASVRSSPLSGNSLERVSARCLQDARNVTRRGRQRRQFLCKEAEGFAPLYGRSRTKSAGNSTRRAVFPFGRGQRSVSVAVAPLGPGSARSQPRAFRHFAHQVPRFKRRAKCLGDDVLLFWPEIAAGDFSSHRVRRYLELIKQASPAVNIHVQRMAGM